MDDMIAETAAALWLPLQDGDQLTQSGTRVDRAFLDLFDGAIEYVAGADFHVLGTCRDNSGAHHRFTHAAISTISLARKTSGNHR
jgi:hypothetical protein